MQGAFEVASGRPWSVPKGQRLQQLGLPGPPHRPLTPLNPSNHPQHTHHTHTYICSPHHTPRQGHRSLPDLTDTLEEKNSLSPALTAALLRCDNLTYECDVSTVPAHCVFIKFKCPTHIHTHTLLCFCDTRVIVHTHTHIS